MNISHKIILFFTFLFFAIAILFVDLWAMYDSSKLLAETQKRRFDSYKLAEELRSSSDNLTRMARSYVITGKLEFREYFDLIADISDGQVAHPSDYNELFWDKVTVDFDIDKYQNSSNRKVSITKLMQELRFSERELVLLAEAKVYSDKLIKQEIQAFYALQGKFQAADGQYSIIDKPNAELAKQLLFGKEYHQQKSQIIDKIDSFFRVLKTRTYSEVVKLQKAQGYYQKVAIAITSLIVLFILLSYYLSQKIFIKPLEQIKNSVRKMQKGTYTFPKVNRKDEIGLLMSAFNNMAQTVSDNIEELDKISHTDELTSLSNRRAILKYLVKEKERVQNEDSYCSIIIADIDYFKTVNDEFGHIIGDKVLQEFANVIKVNIRQADECARWGGEEFIIICPQTSYENGKHLAEMLRKSIEDYSFTKVQHLTASFGVSIFKANQSIQAASNQADKALYKAKESGRNRVC